MLKDKNSIRQTHNLFILILTNLMHWIL